MKKLLSLLLLLTFLFCSALSGCNSPAETSSSDSEASGETSATISDNKTPINSSIPESSSETESETVVYPTDLTNEKALELFEKLHLCYTIHATCDATMVESGEVLNNIPQYARSRHASTVYEISCCKTPAEATLHAKKYIADDFLNSNIYFFDEKMFFNYGGKLYVAITPMGYENIDRDSIKVTGRADGTTLVSLDVLAMITSEPYGKFEFLVNKIDGEYKVIGRSN